MEKELEEQEEDKLILFFSSGPSFKQFRDYEPRLNRLFSRNSLPRIRDEAYVKNSDDKKSKGTCSVSLFIDKKQRCTLILLELNIPFKKYQTNSEITQLLSIFRINIFRIQDNKSVMSGFYRISFTEYMLGDYTDLFSPNERKKDEKIMYKYFKDKYVKPQVWIKKDGWNEKLYFRWNKSWWFYE